MPAFQTTPTMFRRNRALLSAFADDGRVSVPENGPGDPAYSPTDAVTQKPEEYGERYSQSQQTPAERSPGWWGSPSNIALPTYIDQTVGGKAGDTKRLGWTVGLNPFRQNRQPFTGAVLTPPRPAVLVVGNVGRLTQRDTLAQRVVAATADSRPSDQSVANAMINPRLGW